MIFSAAATLLEAYGLVGWKKCAQNCCKITKWFASSCRER